MKDIEQMSTDTFEKKQRVGNHDRHQNSRTSFRTYLFQLVVSYETAIYFLVAPFNNEILLIFRQCDDLEESKNYVRGRLQRKKNRNSTQP